LSNPSAVRIGAVTADVLNRLLREELVHIPRGDFPQNELRMVYNIERRHDLARDPGVSRLASLRAAIDSVQGRHPAFAPTYESAFFGG